MKLREEGVTLLPSNGVPISMCVKGMDKAKVTRHANHTCIEVGSIFSNLEHLLRPVDKAFWMFSHDAHLERKPQLQKAV